MLLLLEERLHAIFWQAREGDLLLRLFGRRCNHGQLFPYTLLLNFLLLGAGLSIRCSNASCCSLPSPDVVGFLLLLQVPFLVVFSLLLELLLLRLRRALLFDEFHLVANIVSKHVIESSFHVSSLLYVGTCASSSVRT